MNHGGLGGFTPFSIVKRARIWNYLLTVFRSNLSAYHPEKQEWACQSKITSTPKRQDGDDLARHPRRLSFQDPEELHGISRDDKFRLLVKRIKACDKCLGLNLKGLTESVPGFGNLHSKIMVVGQSPCRKCMETQIPFSGGSGLLLDRALQKVGMSKSDVFITNVIHCHTPGNRKSLPHEMANCRGYLLEELEIIKPRAIIPLGRDAVKSILGDGAWPRLLGKRVIHGSYVVYPRHHPSYVMKLGRHSVKRFIRSLASILNSEIR